MPSVSGRSFESRTPSCGLARSSRRRSLPRLPTRPALRATGGGWLHRDSAGRNQGTAPSSSSGTLLVSGPSPRSSPCSNRGHGRGRFLLFLSGHPGQHADDHYSGCLASRSTRAGPGRAHDTIGSPICQSSFLSLLETVCFSDHDHEYDHDYYAMALLRPCGMVLCLYLS